MARCIKEIVGDPTKTAPEGYLERPSAEDLERIKVGDGEQLQKIRCAVHGKHFFKQTINAEKKTVTTWIE